MSNTAANTLIMKCRSMKKSPYARLSTYILLTAILLYWQFIFGDKILAYEDIGYDTFHQYVPVYEFFSNSVRNGNLSQYNFIYGLGSSTTAMAGWVADPFTIINILVGVIFGSQYIGRVLPFVQICKILCAGLLALYFLRRYHFSTHSAMLVAYVYAFSGYMMTLGQHYFFSIYPVYYMLLLIMVDRVTAQGSKLTDHLGLSGSVALLCLDGTQSAFSALSGAAVYFFVRVIATYKKDIKTLFKRVIFCALFVLNGILFSCVLFLPALAGISNSSRLGQASLGERIATAFSQADESVIRSGILRLFSNSVEGTVNSWNGGTYYTEMFAWFFSAIFVLLIVQYVWLTFSNHYDWSKKIQRLLPVAVIVFVVVNNFIPSYFNVFAYPNYRHVFIYLPLFALAFADTLDQIRNGIFNRYVNYAVMFISCVLIIGRGTELYLQENYSVAFPMAISVGTLVVGGALLELLSLSGWYCAANKQSAPLQKLQKALAVCLALLVAVNMFAENFLALYYERSIITKEREEAHMLNEDAVSQIKALEGDNLYRFETDYYEGRMSNHSYSFSLNIPTASYYNTVISTDFIEFLDKLVPSNSWYNSKLFPGLSKEISGGLAEDLLGIKYYTTTNDDMGPGWELISTYDNLKLYKNTSLGSMGLLYGSYITQEEADRLDPNTRQYSLYDCVILSDQDADIQEYASHKQDFVAAEPVYVYDSTSISAFDGEISNVQILGAGMASFTVTANQNTSVIIPIDRSVVDQNCGKTDISVVTDKQHPASSISYSGASGSSWNGIVTTTTDVDEDHVECRFTLPTGAYYIGVGFESGGVLDCTVTSKVTDMKKSYTNNGIQLSSPNCGDYITGTVTTPENSILFLPILFDKSWHAYIDNQENDILQADYGFCALKMPKGSHEVTLEYKSDAFQLGTGCSVLSIVLSGSIILLDRKRSMRMRKKEQEK